MNEELVAFAEEVRRACIDIAGAAGAGQTERAGHLALSLCTRAANMKQGKQMEEEQAGLRRGSFDLSALKVNLRSEAPERDED